MSNDAEIFRKAIKIVKERASSSLNRGLVITFEYAIKDHEHPGDDHDCRGGAGCRPLKMAKQVIAGKL